MTFKGFDLIKTSFRSGLKKLSHAFLFSILFASSDEIDKFANSIFLWSYEET